MARLVYSTDKGRLCPECSQPVDACQCRKHSAAPSGDGIVRIRRETKGRKGKGVSIVAGLPLEEADLKELAKDLKKKLSIGGSVKDGTLEFQGDQREPLKGLLEAKGYTVKLAGG